MATRQIFLNPLKQKQPEEYADSQSVRGYKAKTNNSSDSIWECHSSWHDALERGNWCSDANCSKWLIRDTQHQIFAITVILLLLVNRDVAWKKIVFAILHTPTFIFSDLSFMCVHNTEE